MLTEEARRERIVALMDGHTIDGSRVASLIDECAAAAAIYLEQNKSMLPAEEAELIRTHLKRINGKTTVAAMDPDDLIAWIMGLRQSLDESFLDQHPDTVY